MTIPREDWRWFGSAGHLIVSEMCRFHMCTVIGPHIISTVGDYHPTRDGERHTIGGGEDDFFETMVFRLETPNQGCSSSDCNCGLPGNDREEVECRRYTTAGKAQEGHMAMCHKYAKPSKYAGKMDDVE